jgi:hypothetical protein
MSAYIMGGRGAALAQDRTFLLTVSLGLLVVSVVLNIIGLNIGKWLQNAGGVGTYLPLLMLVAIAALVCLRHGSATHFTVANMMPTWNWDTVNFWSQIAFAFTGLELVSAMSEEVRDPRRTLPRAVFGAGALIALMYIAGTFAILSLVPAAGIDPQSGVFNAITVGSVALKVGFSASLRPCWSRWATRAAWAARWPALRACRLWWASIAICRRPSARFIRAGRRRTFRSWCRRFFPGRFCWAARSTSRCAAPINCLIDAASFSTSFRFSTCLPRSSSWPAQRPQ